ncbi:MAG TPA: efflux RND transporter periplasmic adaptor subunit [Acidobacteriota bacterium]|nr:efflux RND transporter periplasmic adaptor subunit [Acidobacteriota bacterium]
MIKRHPYVVSIVVLLLILGGVFFAYRTSQATAASAKAAKPDPAAAPAKEEKRLPVEISKAKRGSISSSILTTASLEPHRQVTMVSETQGIVSKLQIEEGDRVSEGQILALISNNQKQAALEKSNVRVNNAKVVLDRKQTSFDQKLVPQSDLDAAKYEMGTALAEQQTAQADLDRSTIRAPFSGIITERFIEKGQNIHDQQNLLTIVDRDPLLARIYLPEKEVFGLKDGEQVDLSLNSQKSVSFAGFIKQINPAVDPKTGTIKVTIEINNAPTSVRPGSFVDVRLVTQRHDNSLLIPKKALLEEAGEQYLYLIKNGVAVRKSISVGFQDEQFAEVLNGINQGDDVVVAGQGSLRDGAKTETVATR